MPRKKERKPKFEIGNSDERREMMRDMREEKEAMIKISST